MMTLEQAQDWCASHGVTIWEDLEGRRLTLMLLATDVSVSESLPNESPETWQAIFCRLAGKLRLRAEVKERSRAYLLQKWGDRAAPLLARSQPSSPPPVAMRDGVDEV